MPRGSPHAITGWAAVLLLPVLIPIALIARLWPGKKTIDRTPQDMAGFMGDLLDGTGREWDWDEFESVPITDPELEAIRLRAFPHGPPQTNAVELRKLIVEVNALARPQTGS